MKDYSLINEKKRLINRSATLLCEHMTELFNDGYEQGYKDGKADTPFTDTEEAEKKAYNRGLNEAWEAAKKIALMDTETSENVTGYFGLFRIMDNLTASEAIAKIKAYEDKQKQDAEIKVGDEVYLLDENYSRVVTSIFNDGVRMKAVQISKNGQWVVDNIKDIHKTGRHFDQIAEVLAELRGDENDE